MKTVKQLTSLCLLLALSVCRVSCEISLQQIGRFALTPPRGWNSYDSFCWTINEEQFLQNAEAVSSLLYPHGYKFVVVDYLWYRRLVNGAGVDSLGFDVIDEWGRLAPDPSRWPSSANGKGFSEVAEKLHSKYLKFGIHVMRGISTQAYNADTPILDLKTGRAYEESGHIYTAKDIGIPEKSCAWMRNGFMAVNTTMKAGRVFLRSLYVQYAQWGVDFVKHDCIFGDDLDLDEIKVVSKILGNRRQDIVYSLSPGTSVTPAMAKDISGLVNMYRVTGDDWDSWGDVAAHFNVARDFAAAHLPGSQGLQGKSWPDLDMLPLGWLTDPGSNQGPHRNSNLNPDEQRTQMTLWAIAKSPLMFGGDVRNLDNATYNLLTNPTLLEINSFSSDNIEFPYATVNEARTRSKAFRRQSRYLREVGMSEAHALHLTSCNDPDTHNWSVEHLDKDLEQICWKETSGSNIQKHLCLFKRRPLLAVDEEVIYKQHYEGKLHLSASGGMEFCLDASPKRKLRAKESKIDSFSPCSLDANQMWELNDNGGLINSYSGLCAVVRSVEAENDDGGIRAWIATGRNGEVYVAFFNLKPQMVKISAQLSDLAKTLPGRNFNSCKIREVWSEQDLGTTQSLISMDVQTHGTALFVLDCD
ncbi:hypothetical protein HS088_TW06G00714 [Tripterygium wilfordii]|uniref:Alpha-galactosidase n=1 Tax=Tripterygium wilfordii TaxID=458696 RepID=A0A7J7DJQ6_TRIWF|nr:uncharacterized protein LOC119999476 [Tripterygium wilfordii]KAF5746543.1 hypothetical protein HS088_TW06G00714 [Tripterygium wilfordii]